MELFERVKKCADIMLMSVSGFADTLGLKQSTFAGYLCKERQHKLWPLLPKILQEFPNISRQWLYFEEGPATFGRPFTKDGVVGIRRLIGMAEHMAEDCGGNWGDLLRHIAGRAKDEVEANVNPDLVEKIKFLEKELAAERALNRKLTTRLLLENGDESKNAADVAKAAGHE